MPGKKWEHGLQRNPLRIKDLWALMGEPPPPMASSTSNQSRFVLEQQDKSALL